MRNTDTFRQYIWLVNTIRRANRISLEHIQKLWIDDDLNDRKSLSRTTFYRLKIAIEDMFGIHIECDNQHQYFISNPETLRDNSTQNWMLQTLTVSNILVDSLSIRNQLVLEEIPGGTQYLQTIINAIKNSHTLCMTHQGFEDPESKTAIIEPYCLKVFRQRWYLLCKNRSKRKGLRIYALDRIIELTETNEHFELDPSFDAEVFFKNYFGVFIGEDEKPTRIVLRAYGKMIPLIRSLPKHSSQKEISTEETYSDFEYYLAPTFDFRQEILKEGHELEVLEPKSLRKTIHNELAKAIERYNDSKPCFPTNTSVG